MYRQSQMLAIIIPSLNMRKELSNILEQLSGGDYAVIVSDGMSEDESLHTAAEHAAKIAIGTAGRGQQLRRGAELAGDADWLFFLHADSYLPDNWHDLVQNHISNHPDKVGYFSLKFDSPKWQARVVEFLVRLRGTFWALPYGDQGLLISKKLYTEVDGYPEWSVFEDVKIIEKIGGRRLRRIPASITSCAKKYEAGGFFRRGAHNFKLLRRYKRGETIENLAADYQ